MKKFDRSLVMPGYGPLSLPSQPMKDDMRYPCFHYEGPEELDLPHEGKMLVEFCVKREVESEEEGKHWYTCDVEIKKIISAEETKSEEPTRRNDATEKALDALMEARESDEENE